MRFFNDGTQRIGGATQVFGAPGVAPHFAKIIRSFGPYLLALNVTKGANIYPHMVKWGHPADPGSVPSSWDETDETKDTGEKDLPDVTAGVIQDGLPLQGNFYVYKEGS